LIGQRALDRDQAVARTRGNGHAPVLLDGPKVRDARSLDRLAAPAALDEQIAPPEEFVRGTDRVETEGVGEEWRVAGSEQLGDATGPACETERPTGLGSEEAEAEFEVAQQPCRAEHGVTEETRTGRKVLSRGEGGAAEGKACCDRSVWGHGIT
jgi:hypothetical protein